MLTASLLTVLLVSFGLVIVGAFTHPLVAILGMIGVGFAVMMLPFAAFLDWASADAYLIVPALLRAG